MPVLYTLRRFFPREHSSSSRLARTYCFVSRQLGASSTWARRAEASGALTTRKGLRKRSSADLPTTDLQATDLQGSEDRGSVLFLEHLGHIPPFEKAASVHEGDLVSHKLNARKVHAQVENREATLRLQRRLLGLRVRLIGAGDRCW